MDALTAAKKNHAHNMLMLKCRAAARPKRFKNEKLREEVLKSLMEK